MAFGPSFSVASIVGLDVVSPGGLVTTWAVLTIVGRVLARVTRWGEYWTVRITGKDPFGWLEWGRSDQIDIQERTTYTASDLKEKLDKERQEWRPKARLCVCCVVIAPVCEELTFRGLPYLLAAALGSFHLPLLVAGSALWAVLHTRNRIPYRRRALPVFVEGLLALYLWLVGLWRLAILVHIGNNLAALVVKAGRKWWRRWRHPFSPGEEYTVTVDERIQPHHNGLYRACTPNDEQVYVADVEPGEKTRVRVAMLVGLSAYVYPVTEPDQHSE